MSLTKPIFPPVSEPAQSQVKICVFIHVSCCSCFSSQGYINPEEAAFSTATGTQNWYLHFSLDSSMSFLNPEARNSPNTLVHVQICLCGSSFWCRGKSPATAHPGKGRGWKGQLKPAILICSHKPWFILLMINFCSMAPMPCSHPLSLGHGHVKQRNSLLIRYCSSSHGKHLLTRCWSWTRGIEISDQVVPQVWVPMSAAFPLSWAQPWSSVTSHQLLFAWVYKLCPCSRLRKISLTSKDSRLFFCAKDSSFLSLRAQSSHHLWQKDGWQQD